MYVDIRFSKSAFKHEVTIADIKRAVITDEFIKLLNK